MNTDIVNRLIIPPEEAEKLVSQAGNVYLRNCPCRSKVKECPQEKWEVCLLFEHASEDDRRQARQISTANAIQIVQQSIDRGDIHQLFYFQTSERIIELCNCCSCCCSPLREAREKDNDYEGQLQSGYFALMDAELCTDCGQCIDSCFFEARQLEDDKLVFVEALCFGCGACMSLCPEGAIQIAYDPERGFPIPGFQA